MSKSPPIPEEQRSFKGAKGEQPTGAHDRRDEQTGVQSPDPGDADVDLQKQGRFGNTRQNLQPQMKVQDR